MNSSGKKSLDPWQTKTWSTSLPSSTNPTIVYQSPLSTCAHPNDNDVTVTSAQGLSFFSATGTNWGTSQHSFGAGALFTTGSVDSFGYNKGSCNNQGQITTSIEKVTGSLKLTGGYATGTVGVAQTVTASLGSTGAPGTCASLTSNPQGPIYPANGANGCVLLYQDTSSPSSSTKPVALGPVSNGSANLKWTPTSSGSHTLLAVYSGDTSACPSTNNTCGWTPSQSTTYSTQIAASGTTASPALRAALHSALVAIQTAVSLQPTSSAASVPNFKLVTLTKTATMPARLALSCPRGYVLMYPETLSNGPVGFVPVVGGIHGARVLSGVVPRGRVVSLQVACRALGAGVLISGRLGFGTRGSDRMTTTRDSEMLFGGPGNDRLTVHNRGGIANGGLGDDTIVVGATNGIGIGGLGDDRIISTARGRSLLIGGQGHDTLIGSSGKTIINAVDGKPDDVVTCHSKQNKVIADRGDVITGNCGTIIRVR